MHPSILHIADGFWNVRGSHKVAGLLDIGTHASLVRRKGGGFVFLDAYSPSEPVKRDLDEITRGGREVEAILNVHPFHTVHVKRMHELFPNARLYGTARHHERFPHLPWEATRSEDAATHALFAEDLEFSVPRGVDFISRDERVHFSSVLVRHSATRTLHVDDTLMYLRMPLPLRLLGHDVWSTPRLPQLTSRLPTASTRGSSQ